MKKKKTVHLRKKIKRNPYRPLKKPLSEFRQYITGYYENYKSTFKSVPYSYLRNYQGLNHRSIYFIFKKFGVTKFKFKFLIFKKRKFIKKFRNLVFKAFIKNNQLKNLEKNKYDNIYNIRSLFIYISYRHFLSLPVRGQRTKTNAKTRKYYGII